MGGSWRAPINDVGVTARARRTWHPHIGPNHLAPSHKSVSNYVRMVSTLLDRICSRYLTLTLFAALNNSTPLAMWKGKHAVECFHPRGFVDCFLFSLCAAGSFEYKSVSLMTTGCRRLTLFWVNLWVTSIEYADDDGLILWKLLRELELI